MGWIRKTLGVMGLAVVVPSAALAQGVLGGPDSAWYAGGSVGKSSSAVCASAVLPGVSCDDQGTAYRAFAGYQVNRYLSLEFGYQQLGDVSIAFGATTTTLETSLFDLVVLGTLPLTQRLGAYGKLGIYRANNEAKTPATEAKLETNGLSYGIGLQYDVTSNLGVRLEWQEYANVIGAGLAGASSNADVTSVAAIWRFK
jgi:OmpA-OmpF porin, OOP family